MTTHLGLQRILLPSVQASALTTGSIALPSAVNAYTDLSSFDALATYTVPSGGVSKITISGIPTGIYKHLQIRLLIKTNSNSESDGNGSLFLNHDNTANYSGHNIQGYASASAGGSANTSSLGIGFATGSNSNNTNSFAIYYLDILDFDSTVKYKTIRSLGGYSLNTVEKYFFFHSSAYRSLNPITNITYNGGGSTIVEHSQITLYGIRG